MTKFIDRIIHSISIWSEKRRKFHVITGQEKPNFKVKPNVSFLFQKYMMGYRLWHCFSSELVAEISLLSPETVHHEFPKCQNKCPKSTPLAWTQHSPRLVIDCSTHSILPAVSGISDSNHQLAVEYKYVIIRFWCAKKLKFRGQRLRTRKL